MKKQFLSITFLYTILNIGAQAQSFEKAIISNLNVVNSSKLDFAPTFHKDGIVFISNGLNIEGRMKMQDKLINQKGLSILIAKKDNKGGLQEPEPFDLSLVTHVHDGPLTFSEDCKTVYFSRNNNKKAGLPKYVEYIDRMQIYKSELTSKGWSKPKSIFIDSEINDYCHPALSADGKKLYFASDRPGGYGGMDLYVSEISKSGKIRKPVNLGPKINSDKNEVFPFVHQDGTLYFSSNKNGGAGGLDIYHTRKGTGAIEFSEPLSIGAPFNSESDDFGFIINVEKELGYFSSNRNGGQGEDDIYSFVMQEKEPEKEKVTPLVIMLLDKKTQLVIPNTEINIEREQNGKIETQKYRTDDKGQIKIQRDFAYNYEVKIDNPNYKTEKFIIGKEDTRNEIIVSVDKFEDKPTPKTEDIARINPPIETPKVEEKPTTAIPSPTPVVEAPKPAPVVISYTTSGKAVENVENVTFFEINKIYYDFDKANIRKDAAITLDEMIVWLKKNPDMIVEIEGHTDIRGTDAYNIKLSERRAVSAEQYLIKKGIKKDRIKHTFRGKSMLINDCIGADCTEDIHQANRRAEIRIVKYTN